MFEFLFSYAYRFLRKYLGARRDLTGQASALAGMSGLYEFNFALSSVFVNIYLFRENGDWAVVGTYNLVQYFAIVPAFFAGGYLARRFGHVLSFRLGFLFNALVFLAVLILRETSPEHPFFLGILAGLGIGFYYLGLHSLTLDLTRPQERDYFLSYSLFLASTSRILAPALAGWIIHSFVTGSSLEHSLVGYYLVFAMSLAIYCGLFYWSLMLGGHRPSEVFKPWRVLVFRTNPDWNRMMAAQFILGIRNGVFWFVVAVLVYRVSRNEAIVGNYNMFSNIVAVLTAYALSRLAHEGNRKMGLWISSLLVCAACLALGVRIDYFTLLAYAVLNAVGVSWYQVVFGALFFQVVEGAREGKIRKLEYLAIRELPLMAGRILGLGVFLAAQSHFGEEGLRAAIVVLGFAHMGVFFFLPKGKAFTATRATTATKY